MVGVPFVSMESGKPVAENAVGVPFVSMGSGKPSAENAVGVPYVQSATWSITESDT